MQAVRRASSAVTWTLVRAVGELSILTRLSVLAIILVPPIASAWPAIRAGIVGYNEAVDEAADRFATAAAELRAASDDEERVSSALSEVETSVNAWSARFGRMTIDDQDLPTSLALAFFAASFVTLAQLLYQVRAPSLIRKHDEDGFIDWMHDRYPEGQVDRNDGLRRACDALAAAAREDPRRNANLVTHHQETVWIPPKEHIEWFEDLDFSQPNDGASDADDGPESGADRHTGSAPPGYVPGAETARIAIEEGARAEYWLESCKDRLSAWACAFLYTLGLAALIWILVIQGVRVWRAAGFPSP